MLWKFVILSGLLESGSKGTRYPRNEQHRYATINLALGKRANQISHYEYGEASFAVDGDNSSCAQISDFDNPGRIGWWLVDLQHRFHIESVHIQTTDIEVEPLNNFTLTVWEVDPGPLIGMVENVEYCTCFYYPDRLPLSSQVNISCVSKCTGRFVAIIGVIDLTTICEIYIYGDPVPKVEKKLLTLFKMETGKRALLLNSSYTLETTSSTITCARLCRATQECLGFNFKKTSLVENCHLYATSLHPNDVREDSDWLWATMKKIKII